MNYDDMMLEKMAEAIKEKVVETYDNVIDSVVNIYDDIKYKIENNETCQKIGNWIRTQFESYTIEAAKNAMMIIEDFIIMGFDKVDKLISQAGKVGMAVHNFAMMLGLQELARKGIRGLSLFIRETILEMIKNFIRRNKERDDKLEEDLKANGGPKASTTIHFEVPQMSAPRSIWSYIF